MDVELYKAAKEGEEEFLSKNPPTSCSDGGYFLSRTHQNDNILHIAARYGRESFFLKALTLFSNLSVQENSKGETPLHVAAKFGYPKLVELLVSHYKSRAAKREEDRPSIVDDITVTNSGIREIEEGLVEDILPPWQVPNLEGNTPIHEALRNGHDKVSLYLLGLDPETACFVNGAGESLLYLAAESNCEKVMRQILDSELPYSVQGPHGQNPLYAAKYCSVSTVELLLTKRPELAKGVDTRGKTALHYAVEANYWWMIRLILKVDPSIACIHDADGLTPLLRASNMGLRWLCSIMIDFCPESIEMRNSVGQNIVHLFKSRWQRVAKRFFNIPEIKELINERDDEGNTPLHCAIKNHDYMKAEILIRTKTIDLRAINKEGLTALDVCESEWKTSYRQRRIWFLLKIYKARRGRHPNQFNVPREGPNTRYIESDADWKQMANTLSVVATLLATVTFTAAFTMPGGFNSSGDKLGIAVLIKKAALRAFILSDTFALCSSLTVVFFLIWAMLGEPELLQSLTNISLRLLRLALYGTLVAFMTGLYAVTASEALWVAILSCIMAAIVPFVIRHNVIMSATTGIWNTVYWHELPVGFQRDRRKWRKPT